MRAAAELHRERFGPKKAAAGVVCGRMYAKRKVLRWIEKRNGQAVAPFVAGCYAVHMLSCLRNPVCPPLHEKIYRCKHETFHQLQACRIAQAGGS